MPEERAFLDIFIFEMRKLLNLPQIKDAKDFGNQDFIKDPSKKVTDLVKEVIAKTGENMQIREFKRLEV